VNVLIIGGLFVLAIVAILGAILLSRGDEANGAARTATAAAEPPEQTNLIARSGPGVANSTNQADTAAQAASLSVPAAGTLYTPPPPADPETSNPSAAARLAQPVLNGQFHEVAGEIRTLHQQAWQLEQRLSVLAEMVNQVERSQGGYSGEGEAPRRFPSDSTSA
jgi:hypothetical protein